MTAEEQAVLIIRGTIAQHEHEKQIMSLHAELKRLVDINGEAGVLALALLGAQYSA